MTVSYSGQKKGGKNVKFRRSGTLNFTTKKKCILSIADLNPPAKKVKQKQTKKKICKSYDNC